MKIHRWIFAGFVFAILWVLVSGPAFTTHAIGTTFLVGSAVGLPIAYVFRRLYHEEFELNRLPAIRYVLLYLVVFIKEIFVANFDVAYRVLAPDMPIEPQVILIPLRVETSLGVTTIANSITITPGTLTLDYEPDENGLYVHIIDGTHPEEVVEPIRQWEDYALEIFDEEASPSDPYPEIRVHPPGYPPEPKTVHLHDVDGRHGDRLIEEVDEREEDEEESDGR